MMFRFRYTPDAAALRTSNLLFFRRRLVSKFSRGRLPSRPVPGSPHLRLSRPLVLAMWVAALPILLAGLSQPVVQRTQEARVLATAREMLASRGWDQWMIPRLNDEVRLNKPPLAYWAAAASFNQLGVSDLAGRLPFALAGWLTLAIVYQFGRRLIDPRFGLFSAAILLTSLMFYRHFRLAETDGLAALFITAAVYWFWCGSAQAGAPSLLSFHLAAVAVGLAVLAKGPPAAFAGLFFVAHLVVERNWPALRRFLISGALITAALIGGSWFLAIRGSQHFATLANEIGVIARGDNHPAPFYLYFWQILVATAPWTGLFVLGWINALRNWRQDPAARVMLLWATAILLPLCCIGNKQNHYLVPITPALAMMTAYALHRGLTGSPRDAQTLRRVIAVTIALALLAPAGVYAVARIDRGFLQTIDLLLAVILLAAAVGAASLMRRHGPAAGAAGLALGTALAFAVTFGRWEPSLESVTHRTIAAELRGAFGDGPYVFYGKDSSLPLVWNLRTVIPECKTPDELQAQLLKDPGTVVIAQTKNKRKPPPVPPELRELRRLETGDDGMVFQIYALPP
jgi:4-amino-4-deoxy-L-arabinose transferase-like glycosyltransferase